MTRMASIAGALDTEQRAELARELDQMLPDVADQREAFLQAADEALDEYRKLLKPAADDLALLEDRLQRLAETGRAFARAVEALDDDARDLVDQGRWIVNGRRGEVPDYAAILAAAAVARGTVKAADHLRERYHNRASGPRRDKAMTLLIRHLAIAYDSIFGERPSAAREGAFCRALRAILPTAGINQAAGETMLKNILDSTHLHGARPRRGRKKRA